MTEQKLEPWYDERVEPWLEGELPDNEARLFEARLALDSGLRREVARARRLSAELSRLPTLDCPDSLPKRVFQMTRSRPSPVLGWALAGAMALAVAVGVGPLLSGSEPSGDALAGQPDAREIEQARADVALALAYLDRAGQAAARRVGQQMSRSMVAPVSQGFEQGLEMRADEEAI